MKKVIQQIFQRGTLNNKQINRFSYFDNIDLKSTGTTFYSKDLQIIETKTRKPLPNWDTLLFGHESTDHMLICDWTEKNGWEKPVIRPFENFSIHPFNSSLHYALECFEGAKAFKTQNDKVRTFRINSNMHRLKNSRAIIAFPDFDGKEFKECINKLILLDNMWISKRDGYSLYLRPTFISLQNTLGVTQSKAVRLFCVASPVGPYYPTGFKPVQLYCELEKFRAAPHGTGAYKLGSNYGPTILSSTNVIKKGYSQILWLWKDYICEVGTSNIFFYWVNEQGEKELVTPSLDEGYILPGVTRDSILTASRKWNKFKVTERQIKIQEVVKAIEEKRLIEAFSAGTAVIVCPINLISYKGKDYNIPINPKLNAGDLTYDILHFIQDIQYGKSEFLDWAETLN